MTKMHRENVMVAKRKSLHSLLTKCLQRRDKLIVENLKACHQEKLLRRLVSLELLSRS
jgi:16S rRNA A1518/A1519 N6-dimethyltransferase RsmA/KsgA/DIM1 with predicted DNA glycosylase/AP lyase activity